MKINFFLSTYVDKYIADHRYVNNAFYRYLTGTDYQ